MRKVLAAALFSAVALIGRADDFPIKKFGSFTWVVDYEPFWSPDGKQIVLVSSRHGGMKLHVMNADSASHGSDMRQITFGNDEDDAPAWSPDGRQIAFISVRNDVSQLCVINADGSNARQSPTAKRKTFTRHGRRTVSGSCLTPPNLPARPPRTDATCRATTKWSANRSTRRWT